MARVRSRRCWRSTIKLAGLLSLILVTAVGWSSPTRAAGASLSVSPLAGTYQVGGTVDISFLVDTGGDAINTVQADVRFPADKLQVVNPVASTSFISIWVTTPTYSNTDGTIRFQGGLPNPGIKTSGGVISTVTFRVKAPGTATIRFAPTSQVLKNDGQGTNILTSTGSATFTLVNPPPAGPAVRSSTHPDTNQWYNNPQIQFSWDAIEGAVGYSYTFDQTAKSTPPEKSNTTQTAVSLKATADGVWYFHLRALTQSWGGTTTYSVQIDATPPAAFTPKLDASVVAVQDGTTLRFLTTDAASGIDHFEVRQVVIGRDQGQGTLFVEATSPYVISPQPAGSYEYQVRASDRAGNTADGSVRLTVTAASLSLLSRVPLLRSPAVANGALIGLGIMATLAVGSIILRRVRIRSTFQHDLAALERDARRKASELQRELDELQQAQQSVQGLGAMTPLPPPPPPTVTPPPPPPSL